MILINSSPKDALKIFQPFLPISVPIGLASLLAVAEREGIEARFIDEQIEDDISGLASKYTSDMTEPYIFGFSVLTVAFKNALLISKQLKERYPGSVVVFGGVHPSALPEEVLSHPQVDAVIRGEGEKPLLELYRHVKAGTDYTHIQNLSYRQNGKIIHNAISPILEDLDRLPPFPYHYFTSKRYDLGFVVSSRGCPYQCVFCSNRVTTGRKYRFKNAEAIVDELDILLNRYGKKNIVFLDDNLLVNRERIYTLLELIKARGFDKRMSFAFQARGDNVDQKLLQDLYASGFKSVFFGLETASERLMKIVKKGETAAQCVNAVTLAKTIGFHVSATFIYGLPGETHQDRMDCIALAKKLRLDMVRFNNATPYPGTELYELAKQENRLNIQGVYDNFVSVSTFIENPFKPIPFSYVPLGNSEKEIRRDILFSYFNFYLDFSLLKVIFAKPDQGVACSAPGKRFLTS